MKRDSLSDCMLGYYEEARDYWPKAKKNKDRKYHLKWMTKWIVKADRYRNDEGRWI